MENDIKAMRHTRGRTNTDVALSHVNRNMFIPSRGMLSIYIQMV